MGTANSVVRKHTLGRGGSVARKHTLGRDDATAGRDLGTQRRYRRKGLGGGGNAAGNVSGGRGLGQPVTNEHPSGTEAKAYCPE